MLSYVLYAEFGIFSIGGKVRIYFEHKHLFISKLFLGKALRKAEHYKVKYSA